MFLKRLYLKDFRNYEEENILFSPQGNIILGENGQGKTNLLEAIYLISMGRSFRTQHLGELIRAGQPSFQLGAEVMRNGISHTIALFFDGKNQRLRLDANTYSNFRPLLGFVPSILSAPIDTELIAGSPNLRRRFLNVHLAQSDPLYLHHLTRYWRAMKQRNCLLRKGSDEALECWELQMALSALPLFEKRKILIEELETLLAEKSYQLSQNRERHELRFHPSSPPQMEAYLHQLKKNRTREKLLGLTLVGPHRDDLSFWIEGRAARLFASEGQKKTAAMALRLAEWKRLKHQVGVSPLIGIDDFGLPLDSARQEALRALFKQLGGQTFFTTSSPLQGEEHRIHVAGGKLLV